MLKIKNIRPQRGLRFWRAPQKRCIFITAKKCKKCKGDVKIQKHMIHLRFAK